jgi:two-component sensor histidine kinase
VAFLELVEGSGPVHLALVLDAGPEAAPLARGAAAALGRDPGEAAELGLVVSEIVTNAVRHGSAAHDAIILLSVVAEGDAFVVTASNEPGPPGAAAAGAGMGLGVLRARGADVDLRRDPERTVATCRLPRRARALDAAS